MTALILAVTGAGLVLAVLAWLMRTGSPVQVVFATVMLSALTLAGVLVLTGDGTGGWDKPARVGLMLLAGGLAVFGGGPLTTSVLALVDRTTSQGMSTQQAGEVLRGGALIGALERGAIYATVVAGWPEGLAVVLAIKGLARYPELRGPDQGAGVPEHAVAERFIIGTFVSVLWAVTCAGLIHS